MSAAQDSLLLGTGLLPSGLQPAPTAATQNHVPAAHGVHHWPAAAAGMHPALLAGPAHLQLLPQQGANPAGFYAVPGSQPAIYSQAAAVPDSTRYGAAYAAGPVHPAAAYHAAAQQQAGASGGLLHVNPKQLACILRRRSKRQKQEAENKLPRVRQVSCTGRDTVPACCCSTQGSGTGLMPFPANWSTTAGTRA